MRLLIICLTTSLLALGQTATPSDKAKETSTPTFRTSSDLVVVPVVVRSKTGEHVGGLKKEDFTILENGKLQQVTTFEETNTSANFKKSTSDESEGSNELDNSGANRVLIIVYDQLNTPLDAQAYARHQLFKFLGQSLIRTEPTALFVLRGNGLTMLSNFTTDPTLLMAGLQTLYSELDSRRNETNRAVVTSDTVSKVLAQYSRLAANSATADQVDALRLVRALANSETAEEKTFETRQRAVAMEITLLAFQQLAHAYGGMPGRKALLWTTAGFPFDIASTGDVHSPMIFTGGTSHEVFTGARTSYGESTAPTNVRLIDDRTIAKLTPTFQRAMQTLNDANIAVYPIDARGLLPSNSQLDIQTRSSLDALAEMTGGRAYYNTNDLNASLRDAASESTRYYTLAYRRTDVSKQKTGWHKIEVKVDQPGVRLRARNGYMVTSPAAAEELKKSDFMLALTSPVNFSEIPLRVRIGRKTPEVDGKKQVAFEIYIPSHAAPIDGDRFNVDFVALALDDKDKRVGDVSQNLSGQLPPATLETVRADGMNYRNQLLLSPGAYRLRFVVRDNLAGRVGSLVLTATVH
jgi:VWFA-related protein